MIWDEVPQADFCVELDVPHTHRLITDSIEIDDEAVNLADNRYARIKPSSHRRLKAIARNPDGDQVLTIFQQFAAKVMSPHWSSYVLHDQYANLIEGHGKRRRLLAFAHLNPSLFEGFASVTLMGACFNQSVLSRLWTKMGVEFHPHAAIRKKLRYTRHQNGNLLTIRYATEESWSKSFRDKALSDDQKQTVFEHVVKALNKAVAGTEFVWMGNVDVPDDIFAGRGHRLPNSPHGLNPYQHIHHAVIVSALNPRPAHFAFLDALGLDSTAVKQAGYWQSVYQAAMRISLRNPSDQTPKTVTVMDRATADWLASMFPGAAVESLELDDLPIKGKSGRPRKHTCDAERTREHRQKFKAELRAALDLVAGITQKPGGPSLLANELRQKMSEFGFGRDTSLSAQGRVDLNAMGGTLFASIFDAEPFAVMPLEDADQFIGYLRHFHAHAVPSKQHSGLISPAIFDPELATDTSRGLANIRAVWGIWLDNDGGDLTRQEFARLFPKLRMAIFNSYSSTPQKPRWRVFIPTTIAMPIAAYKAITGQIMRTLNKAGYWSKKQIEENTRIKAAKHHGFDMSKLVPCSLFYMPSQAGNPAASFFDDYAGPKRAPLDPYVWAEYAANHVRPEPEADLVPMPIMKPLAQPALPATISPKMRHLSEHLHAQQAASAQTQRQARCDAAIQTWRTDGRAAGVGNRKFFELGLALANAGMDGTEIAAILRSEAVYAHTPNDRRRQVPSVVRTLRKRIRA